MGNILRLDFGTSLVTHQPIQCLILKPLAVTGLLGAMAFISGVLMGNLLALLHWLSPLLIKSCLEIGSMLLFSVPSFFIALLSLRLFSGTTFNPVYNSIDSFPFGGIFLAGAILGLGLIDFIFRISSSSLKQIKDSSYYRYLSTLQLPLSFQLNTLFPVFMIPQLTFFSLYFAPILLGAVVMESIFNLPGIGNLILRSTLARDYPVLAAILLLVGGIHLLTSNCAKLFSHWTNPLLLNP